MVSLAIISRLFIIVIRTRVFFVYFKSFIYVLTTAFISFSSQVGFLPREIALKSAEFKRDFKVLPG